MAHHGTLSRHPRPDCLKSPGSGDPGLFGRLFDLPPLVVEDARLLALAKAMRDVDDQDADTQGDAKLPAGFTYLGQFIDHDVTLDTTPLTERIDDPDAVENFRTPRWTWIRSMASGPRAARTFTSATPRRWPWAPGC